MKAKVTVIPAPFTVIDGKFKLDGGFKAELIPLARAIGDMIQKAAINVQIAMNVVAAFAEYKRLTKSGLPAFVKDCVDSTCPQSTYGNVGSKERKSLTSHSVFVGIEYMVKKGNAAIKQLAERKALSDAGLDPDDSEKVGVRNKQKVADKNAAFVSAFVKSMVNFANNDVTESTIEFHLVNVMGLHEKKDKTMLTKKGILLRDAAVKALGLNAIEKVG